MIVIAKRQDILRGPPPPIEEVGKPEVTPEPTASAGREALGRPPRPARPTGTAIGSHRANITSATMR